MGKRQLYRKPVRDPIAGILSDWFGIENGSARMLALLYSASEPLSVQTIASRTGLSSGSVTLCSGRLRQAGIQLPSQRGRRSPAYELNDTGRADVKAALDNAARLIGYLENPELQQLRYRIIVLEDALGMNAKNVPVDYGLTALEASIFGMLDKQRGRALSRDRIFWALYGDQNDPPATKIIDVVICRIRQKLAPFGLVIRTHWGVGYSLCETDDKAQKAA